MTALTTANLWASASSLVLFAVASRSLSTPELGRLALFLAGSQLVVLVADLGLTNLLIREIAASGSLFPLRWAIGQRLLIAGSLAIPVSLLLPGTAQVSEVVAFSIATTGSSVYSAILAAEQALRHIRRVVALQASNGIAFISLAYAANSAPSTSAFLFAIAASYLILVAASSTTLIGMLDAAPRPIPWRAARPFMASAVASAVTTTADTLIVGKQGPAVAAEYALAQRPALAFSSLNAALTGVLLPHEVVQAGRRIVSLRLTVAYPLAMSASAALGWFLTPVLDTLFSGPSIEPLVVALVFGAFGGGIVSTVVGSWLIAAKRERHICAALWVQTAATLAAVVTLMHLGPAGVAAGVLVGRLLGFAALISVASVAQKRETSTEASRD